MKVTMQSVIIDRDMVLKPSMLAWNWEVPVLQAKYGDGRVRLLEAVEKEVDGLPDATSEFSRLGTAYGADTGGSNLPFVELAYGRGKPGIDALQADIDKSAVGARRPGRPKKAEAEEADPLAA